MRVVQKMKFDDIRKKVKNMQGKTPKSNHCVENAVQRVKKAGKKGVSFFKFTNFNILFFIYFPKIEENREILNFI